MRDQQRPTEVWLAGRQVCGYAHRGTDPQRVAQKGASNSTSSRARACSPPRSRPANGRAPSSETPPLATAKSSRRGQMTTAPRRYHRSIVLAVIAHCRPSCSDSYGVSSPRRCRAHLGVADRDDGGLRGRTGPVDPGVQADTPVQQFAELTRVVLDVVVVLVVPVAALSYGWSQLHVSCTSAECEDDLAGADLSRHALSAETRSAFNAFEP